MGRRYGVRRDHVKQTGMFGHVASGLGVSFLPRRDLRSYRVSLPLRILVESPKKSTGNRKGRSRSTQHAQPIEAVKRSAQKLRVAIVEDRGNTLESLAFLIHATPDMTCAAAVASSEEALRQLPAADPQMVLLDIEPAGELNGPDAIEAFAKRSPASKIVMLTGSQDAGAITQCLARGAVGYLDKRHAPERLPQSLRGEHAVEEAIPLAIMD